MIASVSDNRRFLCRNRASRKQYRLPWSKERYSVDRTTSEMVAERRAARSTIHDRIRGELRQAPTDPDEQEDSADFPRASRWCRDQRSCPDPGLVS